MNGLQNLPKSGRLKICNNNSGVGMKRIIISALFICFLCGNIKAGFNKIILVKNGKTAYKIVLHSNTGRWDSLAAAELKKYIKEISGADIFIISSSATMNENEIVFETDWSLKEDGFRIKTKGSKLIFTGGDKKGGIKCRLYLFGEIFKLQNVYCCSKCCS